MSSTDSDQGGGIQSQTSGEIPSSNSATTCSSIYAVRFGMEGVMGLQNGELAVVEVGDLETKDAGHWRYWTQSSCGGGIRTRCCLLTEIGP